MRLHDLGPEQTRRAKLRDLHEILHAIGKEEGQARCEIINIKPGGHSGAHIFQPVGQRIGQLKIVRGASLLHMVARHRDEIELRHLGGAIGENVRNDPHRGGRRVDIGVAHHEFLQNIILNGAGQRRRGNALFLGRCDEQRQHRHHRAIHRHRDRHAVERNVTEQQRHIGDGINGYPGHADIIGNQRVV